MIPRYSNEQENSTAKMVVRRKPKIPTSCGYDSEPNGGRVNCTDHVVTSSHGMIFRNNENQDPPHQKFATPKKAVQE